MTTRDDLLSRISAFCAARGLTEREFGYAAVEDGRLVERLRCDMGSLKVIKRVDAFLDGSAPDARLKRRKAQPVESTQIGAP